MITTPPGTRSSSRRCSGVAGAAALTLILAGCTVTPTAPLADAGTPAGLALAPALDTFLEDQSGHAADGEDVYEVWICDVPLETTDPRYFRADTRLDLHPGALAATLQQTVPEYWGALSEGRYTPSFIGGSTHVMSADETAEECVDAAVAGAQQGSDAVLAIATAEHRPDAAGGFGHPGTPCASPGGCSVSETGRAAYLGASDFHPDWGGVPALDLLEHEMGHLLGWPHSGGVDTAGYDSALDVMSDSAAPRTVDPDRRHAQGTLGVNRLESGWLAPSAVAVADPGDGAISTSLSPAGGGRGAELLVLPVSARQFLTVEYLRREGMYDFLPEGGVAVTLVDLESVCAEQSDDACEALGRHTALTGSSPFTDLVTPDDPDWRGHGWTVAVDSVGDDAVIRINPTEELRQK